MTATAPKAKRAPLDASPARRPRASEVTKARQVVDDSGVVAVLSARLDSTVGRPRSLSITGLLVALVLNAMQRHHRAHLIQVAKTLNALTGQQFADLGVRDWDPDEAYQRVDRLFNKLAAALEETWQATIDGRETTIDAQWFANRMLRAAIDHDLLTSRTVAIDGTAIETNARLHHGGDTLAFDGDAHTRISAEMTGSAPTNGNGASDATSDRVAVLGSGPDGRNIYTRDPDARGGYRTATNSRKGGLYVGYELHLAVATRELTSTNHIDQAVLGEDQPAFITTAQLSPAGSHRGDALRQPLLDAAHEGLPIDEVLMDPGYSLCRPETFLLPLRQAGIELVFRPASHQRRRQQISDDIVLLDGQPYSTHLPDGLGGNPNDAPLPMTPRGANSDTRERHEAAFNRRARYRYSRHTKPDGDGHARYKCPYCAGRLWNRQQRRRTRNNNAVLAPFRHGAQACCAGTTTLDAATTALDQRIPCGTTAWATSYSRLQVVENANSMLKGSYVDADRTFLRVLGLTKKAILLGATLAGINLEVARRHRAKHTSPAAPNGRRSKRRVNTYADLLPEQADTAAADSTGADPPDP